MSAYAIGLDYNLNIGVETTYGTFASSMQAIGGDVISFDPLFDQEEMLVTPVTNRNEAQDAYHGKAVYGYDLEFLIRDFEFLVWAMGAEGAVTGTDPYTHPLTLANKLPSLSLEAIPESDVGESWKFTGGKINDLTIKAVVGEHVTATMNVLTKKPTPEASPSAVETLNSSTLFKFSGMTITVNSESYEDAAESIEFALANNLEQKHGLSSVDVQQIVEGRRALLVTLDARVVDQTLLKLLTSGTEFASAFIFTNSASHKATFTCATCKVFTAEHTVGENALKDNITIRVIGDWTAETIDSIADYLS